VQFYKLAGN